MGSILALNVIQKHGINLQAIHSYLMDFNGFQWYVATKGIIDLIPMNGNYVPLDTLGCFIHMNVYINVYYIIEYTY